MSLFSTYAPLGGYVAADADEVGDPKYYGFVNAQGVWYILAVAAAGTYKYYRDSSVTYATGWAGRAGYTYNYFHSAF